MRINNHIIQLVDNWQPSYGLIYILGPLELEMLKFYIKNNLANSFIRPLKFLAGLPIFFDKKFNGSRRLYIHYRGLNNRTIKNWHSLSLVEKSFNKLGWV